MSIQTRKQAARSVRAIRRAFLHIPDPAVSKAAHVNRIISVNKYQSPQRLSEMIVVKAQVAEAFPNDGTDLVAHVNKYWLRGLAWQCVYIARAPWGADFNRIFWLKRTSR